MIELGFLAALQAVIGGFDSHTVHQIQELNMKVIILKSNWFKGRPFQFGDFYFNSGKPYTAYRLGPIILRV